MKVTGDSSHNCHSPQVKSQNPSRIQYKTQKKHSNSMCQADTH